jgi:predicted nucleic acid-binding protein
MDDSPPRLIYTDTSVIGGYHDQAFRHATRQLFDQFIQGSDYLMLSDLAFEEILPGPERVQDVPFLVPSEHRRHVVATPETSLLAGEYVRAGVVGESEIEDATHVAIATVYGADVLVNWNQRDFHRWKEEYNQANERLGYPHVEITDPRAVLRHE